MRQASPPLLPLVGVTAIWGSTLVRMEKAVGTFPLFAGIVLAEPAAAAALRRLTGRGSAA